MTPAELRGAIAGLKVGLAVLIPGFLFCLAMDLLGVPA